MTLHQRGHISDGEFFVAKARLLQGKDLTLNPVTSPGVMREELMDALGDKTPQSGLHRSLAGSDTSSLWGTGKGERFADDLQPDTTVVIHRSPPAARATRAAAPSEHINGSPAMTRGGDASTRDYVPFRDTPAQPQQPEYTNGTAQQQHLEYTITDVPLPNPPPSEARSPLPPPARASPPEQPTGDRIPSAERVSARVIYPTRLGTVGSAGLSPGSSDEMKAKATAAALLEANRQVEEQKVLLQREQMKLLKVLNGPKLGGGSSPYSSRQGVADSVRTSQATQDSASVEERMRKFLTEEPGNTGNLTQGTSPREKGRVINLSPAQPPQAKSKDTQFVI